MSFQFRSWHFLAYRLGRFLADDMWRFLADDMWRFLEEARRAICVRRPWGLRAASPYAIRARQQLGGACNASPTFSFQKSSFV